VETVKDEESKNLNAKEIAKIIGYILFAINQFLILLQMILS